MRKRQGWEVRLEDTIQKYMRSEFKRGENCCFCFMSDIMAALCGKSPLEPWVGEFTTKKKAYALLKKVTKKLTFDPFFSWKTWKFVPVENINRAQRGDIGYQVNDGIEELGVVGMDGRTFWMRPEDKDGLVAEPLHDGIKLWRAL